VDAELCRFCKGIFPFPLCSLQGVPIFANEVVEIGIVSFVAIDTIPEEGCLCGCGTDVGVLGAGDVPELVVDLGWFERVAAAMVTLGGLDGGGRASSGSRSFTADTAGLVS
jgi:hypothetical protein